MTIRPTQSSIFNLVRMGLFDNSRGLIRAQEQLSSGRRLLRPSDDPSDYAAASSYRSQAARGERFIQSVGDARSMLDTAAGAAQDVSELLSQARDLTIQALNGTLTDADRTSIAAELNGIRDQVLEFANQQLGDQYLFAGTATTTRPFAAGTDVSYAGNGEPLQLAVGVGATVEATVPGAEIFARRQPGSTQFAGLTGAAGGASTDQGSGYTYLQVRHDATSGALGAGLAFAGGGANDTILGNHTVVVDTAAGTVQLGNGRALPIPAAGDPQVADFRVTNEHGAELHLDFTGFTGVNFSGTVVGDGSVSLDGTNFTALDFVNQDLRLDDANSQTVLFLDTTGIHRAGNELISFGGSVNIFDTLQGLVEDLENADGLSTQQVGDRLSQRLTELDRNHDNVLRGLGVLGARSARMSGLEQRLQDSNLQLETLVSDREDADVGQVILDMAQAQQALETTQAAGARLLQTSLLNFLR